MRVLLTRPIADSLVTASILNEQHIATAIEALFDIQPLQVEIPDVTNFQGIVFSSRHAVRVFAEKTTLRKIPVYCVGDHTAEIAKKKGFSPVFSADGDEEDLAKLLINKIQNKGRLLRLTGYSQLDKLAGRLQSAGFDVTVLQIYETHDHDTISDETAALLKAKKLDGVLFYSAKTVSRFYTLLNKQGLVDTCCNLTAWCISNNVGDAAKEMPFREISIAKKPTQKALIELIDKEPQRSAQMFTDEDLPPLPKFKITKWIFSGLMAWSLFFGAIGGLGIILLADFGPEKISHKKEFKEQVVAVDNRVSALEQRTQQLNIDQKVAAQAAPEDSQLAKILIGLTQLKTAYDNETSLSDGIATLKNSIKDSAILDNLTKLEKQTADNFPSKEKILNDLQSLQDSPNQNLQNNNGDQSLDWKSRAKVAMTQLVRVTPTKDIVKDNDVSLIEQAVASGNFNLARKFAEKLPQTPNTQSIMSELTMRSEVENTIHKIISQIGSAIGTGSKGSLY